MIPYPKDPVENLKWRIRCRERALVDRRFRNALYQACMEDLLFFMAFAMWSFEPRAKVKVRPFIPWSHQEKVFLAMDKAVDDADEETTIDVLLDKSRAQGGTFGYLWIDLRRWLRDPMFSAGYVTRNEPLVDSKTDSNTVLWKVGWAIERLPFWLLPNGWDPNKHRNLTQHTFINPVNGALLRGYAAGQDVAAGGRATVFTCDEFGAKDFIAGGKDEAVMEALHDVTNCVAEGTIVVTNRGPIPIEQVKIDDLVWDGTMWVKHDGCVFQGWRETISAYGIRLTPDHRVLTIEGWRDAIDRLDRAAVRLPDGYSERWIGQEGQREVAVPVRMRPGAFGNRIEADSRGTPELRLQEGGTDRRVSHDARDDRHDDVSRVGQHGEALHESSESSVLSLRRTRNPGVQAVVDVRQFPEGHGRTAFNATQHRPDRQRQGLFEVQLPVGDGDRAVEQQEQQPSDRDSAGDDDAGAGVADCRSDSGCDQGQDSEGRYRGRAAGSVCPQIEAVYDLLNCGPRAAFTVLSDDGCPVLIHNCLRMVSARYADAGVFHEACENPDSVRNGVHLVLDWKDNPIHGKNSYVFSNDKAVARKPEEQSAVDAYHRENPDLRHRLERKGFKFEGRVRSPWYDMRCLRPTATPRLIASQLDRDPRGAVGKLFDSALLDLVRTRDVRPPVWQGKPVFDSETLKLKGLVSRADGPLKLWFKPGIDNSPPLGPFTVGCDIAMGSDGEYSSNSVAHILDDRTGEQVGEYTIMGMQSIVFAQNVLGLCLWLRNAKLGWEDSGVSAPFAKEIMENRCYGNVYYREVAEIGSRKKSRKAGWGNRKDEDKADLFEQMALGMETGEFKVRSEDLVRECGEYEWEKGKIVHRPTKNREGNEKAHGDRCIGAGVAWLVFSEGKRGISVDSSEETGETPEYGSWLWREQQERQRVNSYDPEFGIRDVLLDYT